MTADGKQEILLTVGETKTIPSTGIRNFLPGDASVVDVKVSETGQFVLTGKRPGSSTLLLIHNNGAQLTYEIIVSNRNISAVEKEVQQIAGDIAGVRIRRVGGKVIVEGAVSPADEKRLRQIASQYPGQVDVLAGSGPAPSDSKLLVRLDFFFVQYERTSNWGIGIGYPSSIGPASYSFAYNFLPGVGKAIANQATVANQLLARLDIGARKGWVKVVKQASIITTNGMETHFSSGGEQNFATAAGLTSSVQSVKYGTNMSFLPRYDSVTRDVDVHIQADVSDLVPNQAGAIPGRTTTQVETNVTLKLGQALILSGIKTSTKRNDVQGIPILSEIPILGLFFGSHTKAEAELEGSVFIIPSVVDTVQKSALDVVQNALRTYKDFSGDMKENLKEGSMSGLDTFPGAPPSAK